MTSTRMDEEVERARHDGEAFGREIGERAMGEVRRIALTLAEASTQQAQLKSVGPRASRAIDVGAMGKRQDGMKREAATAWADGAAAGFEAAMNEAASTPEGNTAAAGSVLPPDCTTRAMPMDARQRRTPLRRSKGLGQRRRSVRLSNGPS